MRLFCRRWGVCGGCIGSYDGGEDGRQGMMMVVVINITIMVMVVDIIMMMKPSTAIARYTPRTHPSLWADGDQASTAWGAGGATSVLVLPVQERQEAQQDQQHPLQGEEGE